MNQSVINQVAEAKRAVIVLNICFSSLSLTVDLPTLYINTFEIKSISLMGKVGSEDVVQIFTKLP